MIAAIVAGRQDNGRFPGRNTIPLLGRPLMVYPLLAALHARTVDQVFLTTDAPPIARIARHQGVTVIDRPPELCGHGVGLQQVLQHAYLHLTRSLDLDVSAVVLLLCNAPTVTADLIDHAVEILMEDPSLDAVMSATRRNEYKPQVAMKLGPDGGLEPYFEGVEATDGPEVYFPDALVWVLRPRAIMSAQAAPNYVVNCRTQRVFPLIHTGYGDIDEAWQLPAAEEWLRRQGFSAHATPYDSKTPVARSLGRSRASVRAQATARHRVLITTIPFGEVDRKPLNLLEQAGIEYVINPIGRKLKSDELAEMIGDFTVLIAGTESITAEVIQQAPNLKLIARVGVGLDSVDLSAAHRRGIQVTYTPQAPAPAVAELTIGLMLSLLRFIPHADRGLRNGAWYRHMGRRLAEMTVGVIGVGRIGKRVIGHLDGFAPRILANDLTPDWDFGVTYCLKWVDKETIYEQADIITLHLPLTPLTRNLIGRREIDRMRPEVLLINTSRGNMINERDLAAALRDKRIGGAAIDVFEQEPYSGELATLDRCILTCHMGSMSQDCRARMEIEAVEEALRFIAGQPLTHPVPVEEVGRAAPPARDRLVALGNA